MKESIQVRSYITPHSYLSVFKASHPLRPAMRTRKGGTSSHRPRKICFGTPPSEDAMHARRHSEFP